MFPNVYPCVRPSIGYDSNLRGANIIQHVCSTESLTEQKEQNRCFLCNLGGSIRRKTCLASHILLLSMIALFVRIELLFSSIRRLPLNRANREALFEGSPIRYNTDFTSLFIFVQLPNTPARLLNSTRFH